MSPIQLLQVAYFGPDSFTYKVNDCTRTVLATVTSGWIARNARGRRPSLDRHVRTGPLSIVLIGHGREYTALTYTTSPAGAGEPDGTAPWLTYTPAANSLELTASPRRQ